MADTTLGAAPAVGATINLKVIDNGDGSYSLQAISKPVADQDPIYDHANGEKATVTTSAVVFTPPAGCKFARFDATVDTFIRTDDQPAADDGDAIRLIAGQPEILPVTAGTAVRAYAASSSTLRITPMKVR